MTKDVRELLLDAVPPLPTPPDRIEAIGRRYRRRRRSVATAGALAVAVLVGAAIGVPQLARRDGPQPTRPAAPAECPATFGDLAGRDWISAGRGVPVPGNPVEVTACDVALAPEPDPVTGIIAPLYPPQSPPRVLAGGNEVVTALNNVSTVIACPDPARLRDPMFVVRYADRPPVIVSILSVCRADDSWDAPLRVFLTSYREQRLRTTAAADVPTPTCAPTVDVESFQTVPDPMWAMPLASGVIVGEPPLPLEPAAATFCRYTFSRSQAPLETVRHATDGGERFRAAVNESPSGEVSCRKQADFVSLDVVKIADRASVAPTEFRYLRATSCVKGVHAAPAVLEAIDAVLGPIA